MTYGYHKQGASYGHSNVKGLNALFAIISTPLSAPLLAATRLRKGSTYSPRGASQLVADALATAGRAGATGLITMSGLRLLAGVLAGLAGREPLSKVP